MEEYTLVDKLKHQLSNYDITEAVIKRLPNNSSYLEFVLEDIEEQKVKLRHQLRAENAKVLRDKALAVFNKDRGIFFKIFRCYLFNYDTSKEEDITDLEEVANIFDNNLSRLENKVIRFQKITKITRVKK